MEPVDLERWLNQHWVPIALCLAIGLTLLIPILAIQWNSAWLLTYAMLPVYMFHQFEEHTGDRFRHFVNQKLFHGVEALMPLAVLWINLPGVWGLGLTCIYAASFAGIGWGLGIVYLVLVNAMMHIVAAIAWREYNPGLWTALVLFVPIGTLALVQVSETPGVQWFHHLVGLALAVLIHVAIVIHTRKHAAFIRAIPDELPSAP
ncbi:MAG: HXXEE domain-containing protein [Candidatus Sulfotelmatobacter sp.]